MKKYIKNTNLLPINSKIRVYDQFSDIPSNLSNEVVIVKNVGIYKCNGSSKSLIYKDDSNIPGIVGEVRMFYGNDIPNGWLECNGGVFSNSSYPELYSFLGTTNLPDFRECALRGSNNGVGTFSDDSIGKHNHTVDIACHTHNFSLTAHCHKACVDYWCCTLPVRRCIRCSSNTNAYMTTIYTADRTNSTNMAICNSCTGVQVLGVGTGTVTRDRQVGVRFIIRAKV